VDDERIKQLTAEVMAVLRMPELPATSAPGGLEARVAALENALRGATSAAATTVAVVAAPHPSLSLLGPSTPPGSRCVMEPDKPCVQSGMCRTLGH
jgi:hypothetical protein